MTTQAHVGRPELPSSSSGAAATVIERAAWVTVCVTVVVWVTVDGGASIVAVCVIVDGGATVVSSFAPAAAAPAAAAAATAAAFLALLVVAVCVVGDVCACVAAFASGV